MVSRKKPRSGVKRDPVARVLRTPLFRQRVVKSKKKYDRKQKGQVDWPYLFQEGFNGVCA